jgi:His-Xaa-Ser system protein HxsD
MASTLPGIPAEVAQADLDQSTATLTLDAAVYPLEAVYGAAYIFIDRCFVVIDQPASGRWRVSLSTKKPGADEAALRELAGEFANELLSCAWRFQVTQENRALIEAVTMQAIGGAMGPASLDDLASFDFTEEPFEDPLGIAMSWEDKYKKKDKAPAKDAAPEAAPPAGEVKSA